MAARCGWVRVAVCVAVLCWPAAAQRPRNEPRGKAGEFDFYVLALSWSPEFCADARSAKQEQCAEGRRFAFVVHGLWPQYEKGWPQFCGTDQHVPRATVERMLPIMPSRALIRHAWEKHGSCSGLEPDAYFGATRKAFEKIRIPAMLHQPLRQITYAPAEVYRAFAKDNPSPGEQAFRLRCSGRFLSELWVCVNKSLNPMPCPASLRDNCRAPEIIARPIR